MKQLPIHAIVTVFLLVFIVFAWRQDRARLSKRMTEFAHRITVLEIYSRRADQANLSRERFGWVDSATVTQSLIRSSGPELDVRAYQEPQRSDKIPPPESDPTGQRETSSRSPKRQS